MKTFKAFYNGLDFLNLILFWGTIIVAILIIIFLILYFSRKKRDDSIEKEDNYNFEDIDIVKDDKANITFSSDDIDIIKHDNADLNIQIIKDDDIDKVNEEMNLNDTMEIPIRKKKVEVQIDTPVYNTRSSNTNMESRDVIIESPIVKPTIENNYNVTIGKDSKESDKETKKVIIEKPIIKREDYHITVENKPIEKEKDEFLFEDLVKKENNLIKSNIEVNEKPKAYQKNVFREMNSRNQTSPIGIVYEKKTNEIEEYKESLNDKKDTYLENVYNSLSEATVPDKVELTEYEKKQEEDAVISYQELINKKDTIDYDKEEDAVISYGELLNKSSRLYNITREEKDQEFLSELKEFRKDL